CPLKCNGDPCSASTECKFTNCVDGVCCATACATTCMACDVSGSKGTCVNVPQGMQDPMSCVSMPVMPHACSGTGLCLEGLGATCSNPSECFNNACATGYCRLTNGSACTDPVACASGDCKAGACAPCAIGMDCPSGMCVTSVCKAAPGMPCFVDSD